jgi:hypothetical protein
VKWLDRPDRFDLPEWETLCGEAARLGVALARFDRALKAYKTARDAEPLSRPDNAP